ncbi:MAG: integral membrane protein [uncultured bacterium]|nr:MAG: integral membrane protein [uncultured bacterium]
MILKKSTDKILSQNWAKQFLNFVNQPSFAIPFAWIFSVHLYIILLLPSLPVPNEILSQIPLTQRFLAIWFANSDGSYYIEIAKSWYQNTSPVFFPAWPILIRLTGATFLGTKILALVLTLGFFHLLPKVLKALNFQGKIDLEKLIFILVLYPGTGSLLSPMTEPLYLVLTAATIIVVEKGNYKLGSLFVAVASATRPNGFLLASYLFIRVILKGSKIIKKNWSVFPIALSGFLSYFAYLYLKFGSLNIYFEEQKKWSSSLSFASIWRVFTDSKEIFLQTFSSYKPEPVALYHFASLFFFIFIALLSFKKINKPLWLYSVSVVLLPMLSGVHSSVSRYLLAGFPLLVPFAQFIVKNKIVFYAYIFLCILFQAYFIGRFLNFLSN